MTRSDSAINYRCYLHDDSHIQLFHLSGNGLVLLWMDKQGPLYSVCEGFKRKKKFSLILLVTETYYLATFTSVEKIKEVILLMT